MSRKKKTYDDDDGRTVASMNVDGMPWYVEKGPESENKTGEDGKLKLTKSEEHAMIKGVVLASLLVTAVFVLGALAFILFCTNIWFK